MKIAPTGFWESKEQLYHVCDAGLSNWIINLLKDQKDKQIYDFGCGLGQYLKPLQDAGFTNLQGFEGSIPVKKLFDNIVQQDLTVPFIITERGNVICLEVAEHIPNKYENIFIDNITGACDNYLILSWALREPFQDGQGHINCQNPTEVIPKITKRGFVFLPEETNNARKSVTQYNWFENTVMIFKRI